MMTHRHVTTTTFWTFITGFGTDGEELTEFSEYACILLFCCCFSVTYLSYFHFFPLLTTGRSMGADGSADADPSVTSFPVT